jgi:hypothetical protein
MPKHDQPDDQLRGRSIEELTTPRSPFMPPVQEFDGELLLMERSLRPTVPQAIRQRVKVTRDLAVYGAFCYEFFAVSVNWSYSCVEMALWAKFKELKPNTPPPTSLKPLVDWAVAHKLLPPYIPPAFLAPMRNSLAHPREFNHALTPGMTRDTFQMMVDIVNHLWPFDLP